MSVAVALFDQSSNEVDFGWKWEFHPGTVFEIGVIEKLIEFDNSPDSGVDLGLRHRFQRSPQGPSARRPLPREVALGA